MWFVHYHLTLSVQVHGQVLEDVHVCRVGDGAHGGGAALVVDVSDCLCAHIQHQRVDQLDVVAVSWLVRHLGDKRRSIKKMTLPFLKTMTN